MQNMYITLQNLLIDLIETKMQIMYTWLFMEFKNL